MEARENEKEQRGEIEQHTGREETRLGATLDMKSQRKFWGGGGSKKMKKDRCFHPTDTYVFSPLSPPTLIPKASVD